MFCYALSHRVIRYVSGWICFHITAALAFSQCCPFQSSLPRTLFREPGDRATVWRVVWSAPFETRQLHPTVLLETSFPSMPSWVVGKEGSRMVSDVMSRDGVEWQSFCCGQKFVQGQSSGQTCCHGVETDSTFPCLSATCIPADAARRWCANTLRTGDANLRFYITTAQDGWGRSAFLTRACFPCTIQLNL